jgi:DNA-binding MarR family transcriptional regulator
MAGETRASDREQAIAARGLLMINLVSAVYWFDEALQAGLDARGWSSVTRSQSLILANLATGVNRAVNLARNLGVSRQAMSQMLAEMEERGLITVAPDPNDKRARVVSFSAQSAGVRDDAIMILKVLEATLATRIGAQRFNALKDAVAADWGASPVEIVAAAAGAPLPPRKPRGRPRKVPPAD